MLRWATEGSARCLGRSDIGTIAVGKQADLALYTSTSSASPAPATRSPRSSLCGAHTADRVMVKGEWRVEDGMPVGVDVARLRHEHGEAAKAFLASVDVR